MKSSIFWIPLASVLSIPLISRAYAHQTEKTANSLSQPIVNAASNNDVVIVQSSTDDTGQMGGGSGVLVAVHGTSFVLTNAHVILGNTEFWALFEHGISPQKLRVATYDNALDYALLSFADNKFRAPSTLPLGDSDKLSEGDVVYTIGSSSEITSFMLSKGYVMKTHTLALHGTDAHPGIGGINLDGIICDLAISPGFSGSPLLNDKGEVAGLNEAIVGMNQVATLSIPINLIMQHLPKVFDGKEVVHGFINVTLLDSKWLTPPLAKILGITPKFRSGPIIAVDPPILSAVGLSDLQKNDMIVSVNGIATPTAKDFYATMLFRLLPETRAKVTVLREVGQEQTYKVIEVPVEAFRVNFE